MRYLLLIGMLVFFLGCSGGSDSSEASATDQEIKDLNEIELDPVVEGDWYKPSVKKSWHWQLQGSINTNYDVDIYDIDLFDSDEDLIKSLQDRDIKVICYFSAGSYENWREDHESFPASVLGEELDNWEGERWLDISNEEIYPIMQARLDLAAAKGCDGVEPDNMDGYTNDTGFSLSSDEQLIYNVFIANEARARGLSVGLKNDLNQIERLEPYFDFVVNEQCHRYNECNLLEPFTDANKPVFNAEYDDKYFNSSQRDDLCQSASDLNFNTMFLPQALDDSFRYVCD